MARTPTKTLLAIAATVCLALVSVPPAGAVVFGQIGNAWGEPGADPGQFNLPGMLGVDPVDGSVYAGDVTASKNHYRIQKFSAAGELEASVQIPRWFGDKPAEEKLIGLRGIAVDHAKGRFYLVESCKVAIGSSACKKTAPVFGALRILTFSTEPEGGTLTPADAFPLPLGAEEIYEPRDIAVDPSNGDLVVFGQDAEGKVVLQRISSAGLVGARFVDIGKLLEQKPPGAKVASKATSIAIGDDGATYALTGGVIPPVFEGEIETPQRAFTRAWRLPPDLSAVEEVPGFKATVESEGWSSPLVSPVSSQVVGGPQLAVSPDGATLYWKEQFESEDEGNFFAVRGYSLKGKATSVLYGGGKEGRCEVAYSSAGIATTGERLVVFDYDPLNAMPAFGQKVKTFGPGGDGCGPQQEAKLKIDGVAEGPVTVYEDSPVGFDASESKIVGTIERLEWDFGDGTEVEKVPGPNPPLSTAHTYLEPGTYTAEVRIKLAGVGGPTVEDTGTVEVVAVAQAPPQAFLEPASFSVPAGGAILFDASESWDPAKGSNAMKSYRWSFGDGSAEETTAAPTVSHQFANPDSAAVARTVTLTVESFAGGTDSDTRTIVVLGTPVANPQPEPDDIPPLSDAPLPPAPDDEGGGKGTTSAVAERRQEAVERCRRLKPGEARHRCMKRARAIGKSGKRKRRGTS